ncbi:MAG: phosphopantothenoylcysteine decarboxylase, partial [Janthinobacterium lividum]
ATIAALLAREPAPQDLAGAHALVTAGPTHEPIDPVRYIANRSSGRQGYAIAAALSARGARVTLVSGPVLLPAPPGVTLVSIETAADMLGACKAALPADIAVLAAAVGDWRVTQPSTVKLKKQPGQPPAPLALTLNPDILATLSEPGPRRPALVVGFAAETDDLLANAADKLRRKSCDWIIANDVALPDDGSPGVMGGHHNQVHLITTDSTESWPQLDKQEVADRLAARIAAYLAFNRSVRNSP